MVKNMKKPGSGNSLFKIKIFYPFTVGTVMLFGEKTCMSEVF